MFGQRGGKALPGRDHVLHLHDPPTGRLEFFSRFEQLPFCCLDPRRDDRRRRDGAA